MLGVHFEIGRRDSSTERIRCDVFVIIAVQFGRTRFIVYGESGNFALTILVFIVEYR